MPKESAIPWAIGLFFLLSRGNLLCGITAAVAASALSPMLDPYFDRMGMSLLSIGFMQSTFESWMEISWIAWTRFNNTVVAGSLAVGVVVSLPVYLLSQVFFRVWGISVIEKIMESKVVRLLFGEAENSSPHEPGDTSLASEA
jgi:uncharacterized protein (TIGR03546 family)